MPSCIDRIEGTGIPVRGDNIDTDRIIPARFLKVITFDGLGDHLFEDDRAEMAEHPFSNPAYRHAHVLLVNGNFGSGSSREHAPQALKRWGIEACVGESFSEIFKGNSLAIGLACGTVTHEEVDRLMAAVERTPSMPLVLSLRDQTLEARIWRCRSTSRAPLVTRSSPAPGTPRECSSMTFGVVRGVASRIPYIRGF